MTGSYYGSVDFGGGKLESLAWAVFVVKLDTAGGHLWSKGFGDVSSAVDGAGNLVIAGAFDGALDFGGGTMTSAGNDAFSSTSSHLLSASEDREVRLWHLPDGAPQAILRHVAGKNATYHVAPTGPIDFRGPDACFARGLARCRIGPYSFPFEVCEERLYAPGVLTRLLAEDVSYLEPEFEHAPLSCPPSTL